MGFYKTFLLSLVEKNKIKSRPDFSLLRNRTVILILLLLREGYGSREAYSLYFGWSGRSLRFGFFFCLRSGIVLSLLPVGPLHRQPWLLLWHSVSTQFNPQGFRLLTGSFITHTSFPLHYYSFLLNLRFLSPNKILQIRFVCLFSFPQFDCRTRLLDDGTHICTHTHTHTTH